MRVPLKIGSPPAMSGSLTTTPAGSRTRGSGRSAIAWSPDLSVRTIEPRAAVLSNGSAALADPVRGGDELLGLPDRGDIDQPAVERDRSLPFLARLLHRLEDAPRALDLLLG